MLIDITLALIFVASVATLWSRVSDKLPELIAIPDQVITERFHEDSAQLRLFLLNIRTWYREQHYQDTFWRIYTKILYKLHIFLLRLDNGIVALLKNMREDGKFVNGNGSGNGSPSQVLQDKILEGKYWKQLQQGSAPPVKDNRIREVRVKK